MMMITMNLKFFNKGETDIDELRMALCGEERDKGKFGLSIFLLPNIMQVIEGEFKKVQ